MAQSYEIEIKSLLGSKENAETLKKELKKKYPETKLVSQGKQLNHYFNVPADLGKLKKNIEPLLTADQKNNFDHVMKDGKKISMRTRDANGKIIFVIKASLDDHSSSNGIKRIEFEAVVKKTLAQLDKLLIDSGCTYQAKWSREREEYAAGDIHVCIDKNAGYGYLAEFEKVTDDEGSAETVKKNLLSIMKKLGAEELQQDRLERMFAHYNAHWSEYYGTDKTFVIQ